MPRVIAVSSQKGGIGKTTMTANLAVAWSEIGWHVLLVDLDPQFALTRRFGISPGAAPATAFELLAGHGSPSDAVVAGGPRLDLLAGHRDLAKLELSLAGEHHREEFVNDLLSSEAVGYDVVLIDCPPNLGLLTATRSSPLVGLIEISPRATARRKIARTGSNVLRIVDGW